MEYISIFTQKKLRNNQLVDSSTYQKPKIYKLKKKIYKQRLSYGCDNIFTSTNRINRVPH